MLDAGCWMLDAGCWMLEFIKSRWGGELKRKGRRECSRRPREMKIVFD
jgi:hypothetical protein